MDRFGGRVWIGFLRRSYPLPWPLPSTPRPIRPTRHRCIPGMYCRQGLNDFQCVRRFSVGWFVGAYNARFVDIHIGDGTRWRPCLTNHCDYVDETYHLDQEAMPWARGRTHRLLSERPRRAVSETNIFSAYKFG
eukprot:1363770-Amorphochlora_amoeboformis.AAC.1